MQRDSVGMLLDALNEYKRDPLLEPKRGRWVVLFRSSDPDLWNRLVNKGKNHFALPLQYAPKGLRYLRLRLVEEDQSIIIRMKKQHLAKDIVLSAYGWNGRSDSKFNAHHLGVYDQRRRGRYGTVEVRFAIQGWGFGHRFGVKEQAWAWNGLPLKGATVFEIAVTDQGLLSEEQSQLLR